MYNISARGLNLKNQIILTENVTHLTQTEADGFFEW